MESISILLIYIFRVKWTKCMHTHKCTAYVHLMVDIFVYYILHHQLFHIKTKNHIFANKICSFLLAK